MKKLILAFSVIFSITTVTSFAQIEQNTKQTSVIHNVNVSQFKKLIGIKTGVVLDVRTPEEWSEGVISGAKKIDYYNDNFATQVEKLDKNTPVFVYCKSGGRSAKAANILKEKGFTKVFNLDGGMNAWKKAGNPTVK